MAPRGSGLDRFASRWEIVKHIGIRNRKDVLAIHCFSLRLKALRLRAEGKQPVEKRMTSRHPSVFSLKDFSLY